MIYFSVFARNNEDSDKMQIAISDEQVLNSLNTMETRRYQTDAAFRSITQIEVDERRKKTERLRAARLELAQANP